MTKTAATRNTQAEQKIVYVPTSELESQGQPGEDVDDVNFGCLAASIKKNGFINPITISVKSFADKLPIINSIKMLATKRDIFMHRTFSKSHSCNTRRHRFAVSHNYNYK